MRLFIAIEFKNDYFKELQKEIKDIKGTFPGLFHLTLKFLGYVNEDKIDDIKLLLKKIKFDQLTISLLEIGVFPSENYIRVVWVGLEPKDKIINLQKQIDDKLKDLFRKERKFHPHITLARVKFVKNKKKLVESIKKIKVQKLEFNIDNFKLIKSTLTTQGASYEVIETFHSQA